MEVTEVKRLKTLEEDNARLKMQIAEAMLDKGLPSPQLSFELSVIRVHFSHMISSVPQWSTYLGHFVLRGHICIDFLLKCLIINHM